MEDGFPSMMFGFTALILLRERHTEVDDVIKELPVEKIRRRLRTQPASMD